MRAAYFSLSLLLAGCASRGQLDAPVPCGDTTCRGDQWCVHPCIDDSCHLRIEAGAECPAGYHQGNPLTPTCCDPPTPPPSCVDDPKQLSPVNPKECADGNLHYADFDAGDHQLRCGCTI